MNNSNSLTSLHCLLAKYSSRKIITILKHKEVMLGLVKFLVIMR